ncbi:MAG: thioredoxin family protein [Planctomycetia bacterium]|nr:thioredoxin family protein [Planctomycetia bacterium]
MLQKKQIIVSSMKKFSSLHLFIILMSFLLCAGLAGCSNGRSSEQSERSYQRMSKVSFTNDYASALRKAQKENKPLFVAFVEEKCIFSRKMFESTFTDPKIIDLSRNFICVQVNMETTESERISDELKIKGTPTIQFISPGGFPLQRITQYQPAEELARQMEVVLYSVAWREGDHSRGTDQNNRIQ